MVFVRAPAADSAQLLALDEAMRGRDWEGGLHIGYRASFVNTSMDEPLVRLIEQDVKESAHIAGISGYDAVCLLADADASTALGVF